MYSPFAFGCLDDSDGLVDYTEDEMSKHDDSERTIQAMKREQLIEEVRRLRTLLEETRDLPDMASDALRRANARTEEYRAAFIVASEELARTRSALQEAWRELRFLEFSAPAYSLYSEAGGAGPDASDGSPSRPEPREHGACPSCGGFGSHSPSCSLARALDASRDPRPRRGDLESAVDRAWEERTGEKDGVRSRLVFLDVLFEELAKRGLVRED